jgi:hypothetical protein
MNQRQREQIERQRARERKEGHLRAEIDPATGAFKAPTIELPLPHPMELEVLCPRPEPREHPLARLGFRPLRYRW